MKREKTEDISGVYYIGVQKSFMIILGITSILEDEINKYEWKRTYANTICYLISVHYLKFLCYWVAPIFFLCFLLS